MGGNYFALEARLACKMPEKRLECPVHAVKTFLRNMRIHASHSAAVVSAPCGEMPAPLRMADRNTPCILFVLSLLQCIVPEEFQLIELAHELTFLVSKGMETVLESEFAILQLTLYQLTVSVASPMTEINGLSRPFLAKTIIENRECRRPDLNRRL